MQTHFPQDDRTAFISGMASTRSLPVSLNVTARAGAPRGTLALCAVILGAALLLILLIDWNVMACVPKRCSYRLRPRRGSYQLKLVLEERKHRWEILMISACRGVCVCVCVEACSVSIHECVYHRVWMSVTPSDGSKSSDPKWSAPVPLEFIESH